VVEKDKQNCAQDRKKNAATGKMMKGRKTHAKMTMQLPE
jgi:hypothetical protein